MTVPIWDGLCKQRDTRTGEWTNKRIVVGRNALHVFSDEIVGEDGKRNPKGRFDASVSFNLTQFKMEVGRTEYIPESETPSGLTRTQDGDEMLPGITSGGKETEDE